MNKFVPDYKNITDAARNKESARLPMYEHIVCDSVIEALTGKSLSGLADGSYADKKEYFRQYCSFFRDFGYDTVSYECCIGPAMPGSGSLGGHKDGVIKTMDDFRKYPWDEVPRRYFEMYSDNFKALRLALPEGMRAIGGVGNGIFECVQDVVGYMDLCYIRMDDPELYALLFKKVGETNLAIWREFMRRYSDIYCVLRFGDDLGFKNTTLLPAEDIRQHIIPRYKDIIDEVHYFKKPFLLHSCGAIFDVMDDIIAAGIDAKHSNEDQIAPFPEWVERYGDKIGNFGGIDTDAVCRLDEKSLKEYIKEVITRCKGHGGFAFGSGNSIPDYVPAENYRMMINTVRELRGDFNS